MQFDVTDRVSAAWEYYDTQLEERIGKISELSGVNRKQFVKINPAEFCEKNRYQSIRGYEYKKIKDWIVRNKKDDETFLISPLDEVVETAAQVSYKCVTKIKRTIRASKCSVIPVPKILALDFFIRNHRQTAPLWSGNAVCFGLSYGGELVAVMMYDITKSAVRGRNENYELVRLAIAKETKIHGAASKLQMACEDTLRAMGIREIYSYSNATINSGAVYKSLGFSEKGIDGGQPFVILSDYGLERLINVYPESTDEKLARHGWIKTHVGGNKTWVKKVPAVLNKE